MTTDKKAPKFGIGDSFWFASTEGQRDDIECPDCGGTGRIRVIMHDETQHSIDCGNCSQGYNPPTGRITAYGCTPVVHRIAVTGMTINEKGVEYSCRAPQGWSWIVEEDRAFVDKSEAEACAAALAEKTAADERARILTKEKDTRSWAWNASYHRRCIKDAEKQIAYHTSKLNVAAVKAKETKQ